MLSVHDRFGKLQQHMPVEIESVTFKPVEKVSRHLVRSEVRGHSSAGNEEI